MRTTTVQLTDFAWEALAEEAARQGVLLEDLLAHAAVYYLADLHSGRVEARVLGGESPSDEDDRPSRRRFEPEPED